MKLRVLFFSLLLPFFMSGNALAMTSTAAKDAIVSAETARSKAAKVGYEWRDTKKLIIQAKKLAVKGNNKQAITLALKAKDQANTAFIQYEIETARYAKNH